MTRSQIKYFLKIAEILNFTEAAKVCSISQPTLSKHIQLLEKDVGFKLVKRDTNSVELTPAGSIMYNYWKDAEDEFSNTIEMARLTNNTMKKNIRIGLINGWSIQRINILSESISQYDSEKKDIEIICGQPDELKRLFEKNRIDFFVLPANAKEQYNDSNLGFLPIGTSDVVVISAADSGIRKGNLRKRISNETVFIVDERIDGYYADFVKGVLNNNGLTPNKYKEMDSTNAMIIAVEFGLGIMVHPDVIGICDNPHYHAIKLNEPAYGIYGMYRKNEDKIKEFVTIIDKVYNSIKPVSEASGMQKP